jgi:hypothetical protein
MPHEIHTKRTAIVAEHTASRYHNDKLMQCQICKKEPLENLGLTSRFGLCLSVVTFGYFFFSFVTLSCAHVPKALHDQQYRNTKRLNFCEQNLQDTNQSTTALRSVNFRVGYCLEEFRYQTSLNFIQMISVTQWPMC